MRASRADSPRGRGDRPSVAPPWRRRARARDVASHRARARRTAVGPALPDRASRRLRACRVLRAHRQIQPQDESQGVLHRAAAYLGAIPVEDLLLGDDVDGRVGARGGAEPYGPDRLSGSGTVGSGDTAHRQRHVRLGHSQRTLGHLADRLLAHRTEARERSGGHPEVAQLRGVGIGDEPAFEPLRAARDIRERLGHPAPGAGLGRDDAPRGGAQLLADARRELVQLRITDHAWEATPPTTPAGRGARRRVAWGSLRGSETLAGASCESWLRWPPRRFT